MRPFVRVFLLSLSTKTILILTVLSEIEVHGVSCKPTHSRHLAVMLRHAVYKCR